MKKEPLHILITGAGGPLGANVSRSLRAAPHPVHLVGTDANRWHLPLALTDRVVLIPPARDREAYCAALQRLVDEGVQVILPTHPVEVRTVAGLLESGRLRNVKTCLPRFEVLQRTDDKFATQQFLEQAGVPVPVTLLLNRPADLEEAFRALPPPLWIRGSGAPGIGIGGAALPCRDIGVARAWIEHYQGWGKMVACQYLPGRNLSWMCAFSSGTLLAAASRERLEYVLPHVAPSGVTGAPAVSRTVRRSDLASIGELAVRSVDSCPNGVYFVDFKEDELGIPRVTEINGGRCGTTVLHYTESGFNFPWLLVSLALGLPLDWLPTSPQDVVPEDYYWVRTLDCGPILVKGTETFNQYEEML